MKQIPPIPLKDKYWIEIQKEIERIFNEVLFIPLYKAVGIPVSGTLKGIKNNSLGDKTSLYPAGVSLKNSPTTPLEKAIAEGKVWYADGKFHANQWNAALSRELREMGAKFNKLSKTWTYAGALPAGVSFAIAAAAARYDAIKKAVLWTLDNANIQSIDNLRNLPDRFTRTIEWLEGDFNKALKGITIPPQLTEGEKNGIAVDYSHNMGLYIKNWTEETILELRQDVERMVYAGQRPDAIARLIETKYSQGKRKAAFLASQEVRLLKGTFDRERAKSVGSKKYVWRGRMDAKERDSHVELEGEVIFIDSPPVVDHKTGRRAHAGEDYNCRCVPIYIIE